MTSSQQLMIPGLETPSPFSRRTKHDWGNLRQLYLVEGKSLAEIAKLKRTTDCTVLYALKKLGIPRRTLRQAIALASSRGKLTRLTESNSSWKGGTYKTKAGYVYVYLPPSHPFISMAKRKTKGGGHVLEHRLVIARAIGRPLRPTERVHHKNGIKDDNRLENLRFYPWGGHKPSTHYEDRIQDLERRVTLLEAENARIIAQLEYGERPCLKTKT